MSAHNLPTGSSPCADVEGVCGHLRLAHANVEGDRPETRRRWGGGTTIRQSRRCCFIVNSRSGCQGTCTLANVEEQTTPLPQLLLLVRSPSNTHKHTAVRAAVWVLVVACGPVLFELPLRLPSVQIHYERSSAPPASTACDSKSTQRGTCASARTQPECGRTYRQAGHCKQWSSAPNTQSAQIGLLAKSSLRVGSVSG